MGIHKERNSNVSGVAGSEWLVLTADVNQQLIFELLQLRVCDSKIGIYDSAGRVQRSYARQDIQSLLLREAVGGGSLHVTTNSQTIEIARFTTPHMEAYRKAMPELEHWIHSTWLTDWDQPSHDADEDKCPKCGKVARLGVLPCTHGKGKYTVLQHMSRYFKPYRHLMLYMAGLLILSVLFDMVPPYMTKMIIDDIATPAGNHKVLLWLISGLAVAQIVATGLQMSRGYLGIRMGGKLTGDIRRDMFHALMDQSIRFFDKRQVSQFIGRIHHDTDEVKHFLTDGLIQLLTQLLTAVFILAMLFHLNWKLTAIILTPVPVLMLGMLWLWPKVRTLWYAQWQSSIIIQNVIGEALQGIRVIKAFAQEKTEKTRFNIANDKMVQRTVSIQSMWLAMTPLFSLFTSLCGILIWYLGGRTVLSGEMTIGTLSAYTAYLMMFFGPVKWFAQSISWVNDAMGASERIMEVILAPVEIKDLPDAQPLKMPEGEIRFEDISYGYEKDRQILHDIQCTIAPGEMVGLVGHSGAGKSTLIHLLCRFYDPDAGQILLDGQDIRQIRQEDLRKHIGVVLQETFLFDGSIAQNIAYGCPDASAEQIIEAAVIANAHDFICRLPDSYDTKVGERGHRLSGGEKQRVAIARAVLLNPRILILDEATASVDTQTEALIQEALNRLIKGRTTIAIAHRLSTLRSADRLIVMERGRIVETGSHFELLQRRGLYHKLVESQKQKQDQDQSVEVHIG
ncbi:ABC transporter ATP-binding protein [Paenibacillus pini]|uniref:Lipid A export ATP-binding/permease protein MsbA n=1 Tax=Paenibacillus pini JCM 16418 TaxID=1236976 RepID=W7YK78_9BACL|nr:ABC transporter ATP-binding protein [Paenibacillus pini]GAF08068.1 lipid A export ATP-binding/permease protein MsbA [Paenibacillus pini JCM 16418]